MGVVDSQAHEPVESGFEGSDMGDAAVDDVLVCAKGASREFDAPSHYRGELVERVIRGDSRCLGGQVGLAFVFVTVDVEGVG